MNLLLVEDNLGDVGLVREALTGCKVHVDLSLARDGVEALEWLARRGPDGYPDLILLDLNLPRMDGRELLARVKSHPQMRRIPVVIYTSSNAPQDVTRAYELQANCYLVKPPDLAGIERVFALLDEFWLQTVRLPQR